MKKLARAIPGLYILIVLLMMYLPIVIVVIYSFNAHPKGLSWAGFTTEWYPALFRSRQIMNSVKTSLIVGG